MPDRAAVDVRFALVADLTGGSVATIEVSTPFGTLVVMGEPRIEGRILHSGPIHVHGIGIGPNDLGPAALRHLVDALMDALDCDGIVVEGAVRTTGANPGARTRPIRFTRRRGAAAF